MDPRPFHLELLKILCDVLGKEGLYVILRDVCERMDPRLVKAVRMRIINGTKYACLDLDELIPEDPVEIEDRCYPEVTLTTFEAFERLLGDGIYPLARITAFLLIRHHGRERIRRFIRAMNIELEVVVEGDRVIVRVPEKTEKHPALLAYLAALCAVYPNDVHLVERKETREFVFQVFPVERRLGGPGGI